MKVRDIMPTPTRTLSASAILLEAASLFRQEKLRGAQVLDENGRPCAVFTQDDLLAALASGASLSDTVARHARTMTCSINLDTDIEEIGWYGSTVLGVTDGERLVGCIDAMNTGRTQPRPAGPQGVHCCETFQDLPEPLFLLDADNRVQWGNTAATILGNTVSGDMRGLELTVILRQAGFDMETDPSDPCVLLMAWRDDSRLVPISWKPRFGDTSGHRLVLLRNVQEQVRCTLEVTRLRELSRELQTTIDSSFDGIYITDSEGRTLHVNRAYERITGLRAGDLLGKTMTELVGAGVYDESVSLRVLKSGRIETIIQKVRDTKTIVVTGNPVFDDIGRIWRVVTNVRDVTELRRLQQELERMAELQQEYRREIDTLRRNMNDTERIIIRSKKMKEVYDQAMRVAQVDSSVLITGESGTGKEVIAELIHSGSPRHAGPFIKISCAAIPEQLLESELFGYTPGAFTGALRTGKIGVFETANGGTLFLDEIGEMPLGLQAKLLRVLQERAIMQVGGVRSFPIDVRIIAATNRNLEEMIQCKQFRSDLFYRLNVVPLTIPPLHERQEAIFDFIYHFLGRYNQKYGLSKQIETEALDLLIAARWPGNVRQLGNTLERLVVMARGDVITREEVQATLTAAPQATACQDVSQDLKLSRIVEEAEKIALINALKTHGSTRAAARVLGINQSTVVRKAKRYGFATDGSGTTQ